MRKCKTLHLLSTTLDDQTTTPQNVLMISMFKVLLCVFLLVMVNSVDIVEFFSLHWNVDIQESRRQYLPSNFIHNRTFVTAKQLFWFRQPIEKLIDMYSKRII